MNLAIIEVVNLDVGIVMSQGTPISSVVMVIMCFVEAVDEKDTSLSTTIQSYMTIRIQAMNVSPVMI